MNNENCRITTRELNAGQQLCDARGISTRELNCCLNPKQDERRGNELAIKKASNWIDFAQSNNCNQNNLKRSRVELP